MTQSEQVNHQGVTHRPASMLHTALALANRGWPVLPCRAGEKVPATPHGFKDATTDPDTIRRWWDRMPTANLAIATGEPGPDVLDVDNHGDDRHGFAAFNRLKRAGMLRGALALVTTPRGGLHVYFRGTNQGNRSKIGGHLLDFRSAGGYVLSPPSVVADKPYERIEWRTAGEVLSLDLAAVDRLLSPRPARNRVDSGQRSSNVENLARWLAQQQEGNRNNGLHWAARKTAESGGTESDFDRLATVAVQLGLGDLEIQRTIRSAQNAARKAL